MPPNTICPTSTPFDETSYETSELLQNPYQDQTTEVTRFSADVPIKILARFKAIMPYRGAIQATINTIIYGLLKEFEKQDIRNYDPLHKPQIVKIIKSRAFGEIK